MDKKLKSKWIKALRGGRYKQGQQELYKDGKYCCLGVLARVQGCSIAKIANASDADASKMPLGFGAGLRPKTRENLIIMNDGGEKFIGARFLTLEPKSFSEIADYIEKRL